MTDQSKILPAPGGEEAAIAVATRFLAARFATTDEAIAVALEIARCENHERQARVAALKSVARLMTAAATIGTTIARINEGTHHRITVERLGGDKLESLSPRETAESREKPVRSPRARGSNKNFAAHENGEPSKHLRRAYE